MQSYETRSFECRGETFETRISSDGLKYEVRVYKANGAPANECRYAVEVLTQLDAQVMNSSINPLESLINAAQRDVEDRTWEKYLAAVEASRTRNG